GGTRLPPYAGVNRIRFGGSKAAAFLSTAHQRSPGDEPTLGAIGEKVKGPWSSPATGSVRDVFTPAAILPGHGEGDRRPQAGGGGVPAVVPDVCGADRACLHHPEQRRVPLHQPAAGPPPRRRGGLEG